MAKAITKADRYLIFDESGNLGTSGRYFVIACVDTKNVKSLHSVMKNQLGKAKKTFPELAKNHFYEIKAKDAYPAVKYKILQSIASKDLSISYIVADLKHVAPRLLKEKNIFYNYLMRILIEKIVSAKDNKSTIAIVCDQHTTKVASANSFEDYIKIHLLYERRLDLDLSVTYLDSDSKQAFAVQAADYVANAVYGFYEHDTSTFNDAFNHVVNIKERFPYKKFGK